MLKRKKREALQVKVFESKDGKTDFIVFRTPRGAYHVFVEVDAKKAAIECGMEQKPTNANTRQFWNALWKKGSNQVKP